MVPIIESWVGGNTNSSYTDGPSYQRIDTGRTMSVSKVASISKRNLGRDGKHEKTHHLDIGRLAHVGGIRSVQR